MYILAHAVCCWIQNGEEKKTQETINEQNKNKILNKNGKKYKHRLLG